MAEEGNQNQNTNPNPEGGEGKGTENKPNNQNNQGQKQDTEKPVDVEGIKKDAVSAYLKGLGVDEESLKGILQKNKEEEEANKTELQKKDDALKETTKKLVEEQKARMLSDAKIAAIKLGARSDLVDDIVILAQAKVTDDKDIQKVVEEMKEGDKSHTYFVDENEEKEKTKNRKQRNVTRKRTGKQGNSGDDDEDDRFAGTLAGRLMEKNKNRAKKKTYYTN